MAKKASKKVSAPNKTVTKRPRNKKPRNQQREDRLFTEMQQVNSRLSIPWVGLKGTEFPIEIWDGSDLEHLREAITALLGQQKYRVIGIDMNFVMSPAGGFYGMMFSLAEKYGTNFRLRNVHENIVRLAWSCQFCSPCIEEVGTWLFNTDQRKRHRILKTFDALDEADRTSRYRTPNGDGSSDDEDNPLYRRRWQ